MQAAGLKISVKIVMHIRELLKKRQIDIYSVTRDIAIVKKHNFRRRRANSISPTVYIDVYMYISLFMYQYLRIYNSSRF
jgi:hypothetical protein